MLSWSFPISILVGAFLYWFTNTGGEKKTRALLYSRMFALKVRNIYSIMVQLAWNETGKEKKTILFLNYIFKVTKYETYNNVSINIISWNKENIKYKLILNCMQISVSYMYINMVHSLAVQINHFALICSIRAKSGKINLKWI